MAQQVIYTDDLDKNITDDVHTVTVTVSDKGNRISRKFQIDLGADNAKKLENALNRFARAGVTMTYPTASASTSGDSEAKEIRQWAQAHGYKVAERGAIPNDVREAFEEAMRQEDGDITSIVPAESDDEETDPAENDEEASQ